MNAHYGSYLGARYKKFGEAAPEKVSSVIAMASALLDRDPAAFDEDGANNAQRFGTFSTAKTFWRKR